MTIRSLLLTSCILFLSILSGNAQCSLSGASIVTSYTTNNGSRGAMFDLIATNTITVTCFDANLYSGTANYEIYYKVGTYIGSESNPADWTLVGASSVVSLGPGVPTPLPIPVNITIPAGQTYGFYVTNTISGGINYTTSPTQGETLASDANLTMVGGVGKAYPFLTNFNYRLFSGTAYYVVGTPLPVELAAFFATPLERSVTLSWETQSEVNNDFFTVERSADGSNWSALQTVDGAGNSQHPIHYEWTDNAPLAAISYYRLKQTDNDGTYAYSEIRSVNRQPAMTFTDNLVVSPNPAHDVCFIHGTPDELGTIRIFDLYGRDLSLEVALSQTSEGIVVDLSAVNSGMLVVRAGDRSALVFKD